MLGLFVHFKYRPAGRHYGGEAIRRHDRDAGGCVAEDGREQLVDGLGRLRQRTLGQNHRSALGRSRGSALPTRAKGTQRTGGGSGGMDRIQPATSLQPPQCSPLPK
jgi:hypothetical protein